MTEAIGQGVDANEWINSIRSGGNVTRYHTKHMNRDQDVAQHSYNCALIVEHLARFFEPGRVDPHRMMLYMLVHDIPEVHVGDTPYEAKSSNPLLNDSLESAEQEWMNDNAPESIHETVQTLTPLEQELCSFVDRFESFLKLSEEMLIGNRSIALWWASSYDNCLLSIDSNEDLEVLRPIVEKHMFDVRTILRHCI